MSERTLVDFLKAEVLELLNAGRVGLYEFFDVLRAPEVEVDDATRRTICEAALAELRAEEVVRLVWQRWADLDFCEDASSVVPGPDAWRMPERDPYLAVVPTERAGE